MRLTGNVKLNTKEVTPMSRHLKEYKRRIKERLVFNGIDESDADLIIEHWNDKINQAYDTGYPSPEEAADFIQSWTFLVNGKYIPNP